MYRIIKRGAKAKFFLITFLFFFFLFYFSTGEENEKEKAIKIEKINISELRQKISELKGKVLILNFWATWCPPCKKQIPVLTKIYKRYKEKGIEIIGVAIEENDISVVEKFVKKAKINYPIYFNEDEKIEKEFKIEFLPTTFIFRNDKKVEYKFHGPLTEEKLEKAIKKLIEEKGNGKRNEN